MLPRKTPVSVGSTFRLGIYLAALGALVVSIWEWSFISRAAFLASAFFMGIAALEYWGHKRRTSSPMKSLRTGKVLAGSNAFGFELVDREDNIRHERVVEIKGQRVLLLLPEDEHGFGVALPFAQKLIDELEDFSAAFDIFKQTVTAKVGSEDIGELSIAAIEFYGIQPEVAEVVFQPTSSGRFWVALYKTGELSNMHEET